MYLQLEQVTLPLAISKGVMPGVTMQPLSIDGQSTHESSRGQKVRSPHAPGHCGHTPSLPSPPHPLFPSVRYWCCFTNRMRVCCLLPHPQILIHVRAQIKFSTQANALLRKVIPTSSCASLALPKPVI